MAKEPLASNARLLFGAPNASPEHAGPQLRPAQGGGFVSIDARDDYS